MDDEETPEDPKAFTYFCSTDLRHNIFITFRDYQGKRLFDIDSRPTIDPNQYRHGICLSFSRLNSSICISECFANIMHAGGQEVHGKVAEKNEEMRIVATLTLPGASFVVEKGAQERSPWPARTNDFVIELALLRQTTAGGDGIGIPRDRLTIERIGQTTTRLEADCGELGLSKYLKRLVDVNRICIYVEDYRGNRTFSQDVMREVLLPRFLCGSRPERMLPSEVPGHAIDQREIQVSSRDSKRKLTRTRERRRKRKRKAEEEDVGRVEVDAEVAIA